MRLIMAAGAANYSLSQHVLFALFKAILISYCYTMVMWTTNSRAMKDAGK